MSQPITHVLVTAAEGRLVPVPPSELSVSGAPVATIEAGKVYRLPWSTYTRRRLASGDLLLVDAKSKKPTKSTDPSAAAVGVDLKLAADGSVDEDQRPDEVINAASTKAAELEAKKAAAATTPAPGKDH